MRDAERRTKRRALTRIIHSVLRKDDALHYFQVCSHRALHWFLQHADPSRVSNLIGIS